MAAANTDKLKKSYSFLTKTLGSGIGSADLTIPLNNTTNIPTDTAVDFIIDRVDANGNLTPTSREIVTGVVSGSNIVLSSTTYRGRMGTTAQAHSGGAVVEFVVSAQTHNDLIDALLVEHTQAGLHSKVNGNTVPSGTDTVALLTALQTIQNKTFDSTNTFNDGIINPGSELDSSDRIANYVKPGTGVVAISAGLVGTFSNITYYIAGKRYTKTGIANKTYTASKDTYVDIDTSGTVTYTEVANNAASPALAANSIRVAIVVTSGAAITSINQGSTAATAPVVSSNTLTVCDSLGNLIYPQPSQTLIGYRQITGVFAPGTNALTAVTGLSVPVTIPAGRRVRISFGPGHIINGTTAINDLTTTIWDGAVGGGTQLASNVVTNEGNSHRSSIPCSATVTPAAGSKTYNVGIQSVAGNPQVSAAATAPQYVQVDLV